MSAEAIENLKDAPVGETPDAGIIDFVSNLALLAKRRKRAIERMDTSTSSKMYHSFSARERLRPKLMCAGGDDVV